MIGSKKILFVSDDLALNENSNEAIFELINENILNGASILANGEYFNKAIELFKNSKKFSLGVHLNIIEGKSLTNCKVLGRNGVFNLNYLQLILLSFNKNFLNEVEVEFRAQIEKTINEFQALDMYPERLDSHVHTHAIPNIFKIVEKLALEYKISYVRLQNEYIYKSNGKYPKIINLIKIFLLKFFTFFNKKRIKRSGLKFNDFIVGVGFTGEMNKNTIEDGINSAPFGTVEVLIHAEKNSKNNRVEEYKSAKEIKLN